FAFAEKQGVTKEGDDLVGPPIEVRIRRVASKAMKRASELLKRNPYYVGETSLPTGYLDAEHLSPHETRTTAAFAERLRAAFPREIARVTSGETLAADLPSVTTPTLVVSYRLEPSGEAYASKKPRGIYMGLVFFFDIAMLMPPQEQALQSKHVLTTKIPVDVLAAQPFPNAPGAVERALYDAMLEKGFTEMERRYFTQWYE
ncbi:MAG: hypothetical protein KC731_05255, partial [Myxococcales bacterium]|nr:hypothetical protein [Myxococcales bacterium]